MTDKEFFAQTITNETPIFERVVKALPVDKLDWKPDPKSKTALELASAMAGEAHAFKAFFTTGILDESQMPKASWKNPDEIAAAMTSGLSEAASFAAGMTDADWAAESKMTMGDKEVWKTTKGGMALGLLLDLVHHRGQLSTYIRPMGGKVPSIYGPSADTQV